MEEKKEVLKKLKNLNDTYCESQSVLFEMENVYVEDNYERKIVVPSKPDCPPEVSAPSKNYLSKKHFTDDVTYIKGLPIGFGVASLVQIGIYFAIKSGVKGDGSNSDNLQQGFATFALIFIFVLLAVCIAFLVIDFLRYKKALAKYSEHIAEVDKKYKEDDAKYKKYLSEYKLYEEKINIYNDILTKHKFEEESINDKIQEERAKIANSIKETKYIPLIKKLEKDNDGIIGEKYYHDLSQIIDLMESGRADTVKEAINVVEDIKFKERQLALEREKMEREDAARFEEEQRQEENWRRERQREEDNRRREERQREEDRKREDRQREEDRKREEERRSKQAAKDHEAALHQCSNCANIHGCRNYAKYPNCPNYKHN